MSYTIGSYEQRQLIEIGQRSGESSGEVKGAKKEKRAWLRALSDCGLITRDGQKFFLKDGTRINLNEHIADIVIGAAIREIHFINNIRQ